MTQSKLNGGWPELPEIGQVIAGKYRLDRLLGRGGMGIVYEAWHELLAQKVAIKLLLPEIAADEAHVKRFVNEARAAARIQNEHVARVMDVGLLDGGLPFIVMELLEGSDLAEALETRGALPIVEVVDAMMQALEAVANAHAVGIVHRDLKPPNVFVARRADGSSVVKVLDFGISKLTGAAAADTGGGNVTATSTVIGSPAYMSPEQLRSAKNVDARTDIWAIGAMAYELLTGALPFTGENVVELFAVIMEKEPVPPRALRPEIPPALEAVVMRCLRRSPDERWPNALELARALAPFGTRTSELALERIERLAAAGSEPSIRSSGVAAQSLLAPPRTTERDARGARRWVVPTLVGGVVVVALGILAALLASRPKHEDASVARAPSSAISAATEPSVATAQVATAQPTTSEPPAAAASSVAIAPAATATSAIAHPTATAKPSAPPATTAAPPPPPPATTAPPKPPPAPTPTAPPLHL